MKALALVLLPLAAFAATPDEILRHALANFQKDQVAGLHYTHMESEDTKGKGVEVSQLTVIDGTPYERILSRNGEPLKGDAERREAEKYRRAQEDRKGENDAQRAKRIRKYCEGTKILMEGVDAFNLRLVGEEKVSGRPAYVLEATPKPGYRPPNMKLKMFIGIRAKIWVDKQDLRIARGDATVVDTVALGWILARIGKGGHLSMEQIRLPDGTWAPKEYAIDGTARIMLVDEKKIDMTITFYGYQPISRHASNQVAERASR